MSHSGIVVSIHAFRGEGDWRSRLMATRLGVSIHAFRGEGDVTAGRCSLYATGFNPRLPGGRRRPCTMRTLGDSSPVSIHAFRGEGDASVWQVAPSLTWFQSTPSGGKATIQDVVNRLADLVSIHAFRGEGDFLYAPTVRRA